MRPSFALLVYCRRLDQTTSPRRVSGGSRQQPADGVLLGLEPGPRCPAAWGGGAARRRPRSRVGLHPGGDRGGMPAVRLGLRVVKGLSEAAVGRSAHGRGPSAPSSVSRTSPAAPASHPRDSRRSPALNAFRSLSRSRREAVWESLEGRETAPLFDGQVFDAPVFDSRAEAAPEARAAVDDRPTGNARRLPGDGTLLAAHPFTFLRDELTKKSVLPTTALAGVADGERCSVAGLVLNRQRPGSAQGITFMTLEDRTGNRQPDRPAQDLGAVSSRRPACDRDHRVRCRPESRGGDSSSGGFDGGSERSAEWDRSEIPDFR